MYEQLPHPTIFAHRGASAHAPENTLAAFELALRQGTDAVELDAKLSADGQVVVIHDQTVDRTTNGHGSVKDLTLTELRRLDAGSHFDIAFQGEPIPTLEEVFKAVGQLTFLNIELTNYASPTDSLPQKIASLVQRYHLTKRILFSSFHPIPLLRIHRLVPDAPIGLLCLPGKSGAWARSWLGRLLNYQALHPEAHDVTASLVEKTHRRGCRLYTFTVNQPETMRTLFSYGVDGVFTDDPVLARQVFEGVRQSHP
jgi:glycerophosphoryl diester phosphodiesterase